MPSSTSSSDERLPDGPWGRTWVLALAILVASLASLEAIERAWGFVPTVVADPDLWCIQRAAATRGGRDAVAVLGTSRMNAGLDTAQFRGELPGRSVAFLAVPDSSPIPTLGDLADDEAFSGVVLCELFPLSPLERFWDARFLEEHPNPQARHVNHYRSAWGLNRSLERALRSYLEAHLALCLPQTRIDLPSFPLLVRDCLEQSRLPRMPRPGRGGRLVLPDGSTLLDYSKLDSRELDAAATSRWESFIKYPGHLVPPEKWKEPIRDLGRSVAKIRSRGGKVVFIDFPISGRQREYLDRYYPRTPFWDLLAQETAAELIQSEKVPSLASFECPDGLHMDYRDAASYTKNLIAELRMRGILPRVVDPARIGFAARPGRGGD